MEKRGCIEVFILLVVAIVALILMLSLFYTPKKSVPSGAFVYAGNRVQLMPQEGCAGVVCADGIGIVVNVRNTKFWEGPPQVADCICPEDVTAWNEDRPAEYNKKAVRTVRLIKNYNEFEYKKYE